MLSNLDRRLVSGVARLPRTVADPALRGLSRAANHSVLWLTVATVLASRRGRPRRAALRGVAAVAGASATANLVAKTAFPRRRPAADLIPPHRRLTRRPVSSAFPSGHAASAAAFTTAVTLDCPPVGAALAPVAAAVAYSRVHTGLHWPSDVAAGAALGVGVGLATLRWWPTGRDEPAGDHTPAELPRLTDGAGLSVLVNPGSGRGEDDDPAQPIRDGWPAARLLYPDGDGDLVDRLRHGATGARVVGVAGGDGTVSAAAAVAAETGRPLLVIPAGTLNHFARDLGVAELDQVREATGAGTGVEVGLATVGVDGHPPRWFVNTASLGGYPDLVRLRERLEGRWGKWPAAAVALVRVLARAQPLELELDGRRLRLWMLFVGNGEYLPKGFAPTSRPRLDTGQLDVRYLRADLPLSRTRFVLAALLGALHRSRVYRQLAATRSEVRVLGVPVSIATDGEVGPRGHLFRFNARPGAVSVYRPDRRREV
jgi:undecaprenyl-diphosphatase